MASSRGWRSTAGRPGRRGDASRGRISFGKAGVRRDDRYAIAVDDHGSILLTPLASIPKRELLVWEDAQLRDSLARGLAQSAAGETVELGDFTQFADDVNDE